MIPSAREDSKAVEWSNSETTSKEREIEEALNVSKCIIVMTLFMRCSVLVFRK